MEAHKCPYIVADISWGRGGGGVCSNTRINNNCSVDSDDDFSRGFKNVSHYYSLPSATIFKSPLIWKTKLRGPMVLLCGNCSLFNIYHKTGSCEILKANSLLSLMYMCVPINRFVNPFTVQNDLLITFSLCHSSADHNQLPLVVCK